ncbi:aminodeoxychorismate lyase [Tolumonas lignilytica]|jgi:aminodeoxychorismate lyase|uniref:aminodeoxychorismate lyase n=1 Tax=Tolumonas lignilytica TaxID=1283284 RepID=UPI0004BB97DF|nr:aminodeoxychorismate lyase [Tolumonas lignilytica]
MILVNGSTSSTISVQDRGLTLGDGHFTTLLLKQQRPQLWHLHIQRIQQACARLKLLPPDFDTLYEQCCQLAASVDTEYACGKIIMTRGVGGRGYSPQGCHSPSIIVSAHPYPIHYLEWQRQGIILDVAEQRVGWQPILAGLKTLNRLEQILLKDELDHKGLAEAVVLDWQGNVVEAVTANLFWRKEEKVYTPDLQQTGVCGVMRAFVMQQLMDWQYPAELVSVGLDSLLNADEIWITNALMGVVPVIGIKEVKYEDHRFAKRLQSALATLA